MHISEADTLECTLPRFVSRGGLKLLSAINECNIRLDNRVCLDVGASTGGFTDCMLQHRAAFVHAVDTGTSQLHESLLQNPRVNKLENTNILNIHTLSPVPSFAAVDVSFVSVTKILPHICSLLAIEDVADDEAIIAVLVKPQFECGRSALSKRGVVHDKRTQLQAVELVCAQLGQLLKSRQALHTAPSPILGGNSKHGGNTEFLVVF